MPENAPETAYYLDPGTRVVALVAKGVRFPAGRWMRVAEGTALTWIVEQMLLDVFASLKAEAITWPC